MKKNKISLETKVIDKLYREIVRHIKSNKDMPSKQYLAKFMKIEIKVLEVRLRSLRMDGHIETDYSLNITGCPFTRINWITKPILASA